MIDNRDLLERTEKFSKQIIELSIKIPRNSANNILISQCVRSVTSIGANYREACEAESAKDFVHKIRIAKKEARESLYWLELLLTANHGLETEIKLLMEEGLQLVKILSSISSKFKK